MRSRDGRRVAIVGAGFSGTMTAVHLLARGFRVTLIDSMGRFGEGIAYGAAEPEHLLNVRASNMSAFSDRPGDFAKWLEAQGLGNGTSFAPRRVYRDYLHEILNEAGDWLERVADEAVALDDGVRLASGVRIAADAVVIAAGNLPPEPIRLFVATSLPTVNDPWSVDGRAALAKMAKQNGDILVIGTGLTMIDTVLSLNAFGFAGQAIALSRRGLVPRVHAQVLPMEFDAPGHRSPSDLARWVRRQAQRADWRGVVDALRPVTAAIWQGWTPEERGRFLRHLRPWWDVHRHRIAPDVSARIEALIADGRLVVRAGRIVEVLAGEVSVRQRGREEVERLRVAGIINCTGPLGNLRRSGSALIRDMLARGTANTDAHGLGIDVDQDLRAVSHKPGSAFPLYAVGPMTRGTFWETVAVPDIRGQAQRLAEVIDADLGLRAPLRVAAR